MKISVDKEKLIYRVALGAVFGIAAFYRLYQPIKFQALTQFDIFDWATQSKQILLSGQAPAHNLFVFPLFNSIISRISGIDLFYVYLFGGVVITLLAFWVIYQISILLFDNKHARLMVLLLYSTSTFILARSIMYLPEAFTYLIGMYLVYLFVKLFKEQKFRHLLLIMATNYFFFHLHQAGMNFIVFSLVATLVFIFLHNKYKLKSKIYLLSALALLTLIILWLNKSLVNNFKFFITKGNDLDPAFNGAVIPYSDILTTFSTAFFILISFGSIVGLVYLFKRQELFKRQAFLMVFLIAFTYFCFLYLFPNLNIYRLYPWRFYTWFSLYGCLLAGFGINFLFNYFANNKALKYFIISFIIFFSIPASIVFDNMFTADFKTLDLMSKLPINQDALVLTTNANYFQAKYALLGKPVTVNESSPDLFRAASSQAVNDFLKKHYTNPEIYILISKFQLDQRPGSIDYWRNHAIFDMDLKLFADKELFFEIYKDDQVLLIKPKT